MVWQTFITSWYKTLIDSLTKFLTFITCDLLFNILYIPIDEINNMSNSEINKSTNSFTRSDNKSSVIKL